ncbi:MAG: hypothetical protein QOJ03_1456 [Frankiaceae bacterium]|jgi:inhibitor of cysteine peptidase|nr:hypothetical protein [Frankiaceae bacterium]
MAVIRIDQQYDGKRVTAQVGDSIEVTLPEIATTGFRWEVDETGAPLEVQTSEHDTGENMKAGATGNRHVVVKAARPGNGRLSLRLRRSWEAPDEAEDTFAVDVDVT